MDRRQFKALERRVHALARAESATLERLVELRPELERLVRLVNRLTFTAPRDRRKSVWGRR
jgi:uncharacterized sporulation protein YeaH/YhbH (DUF444 family)